jgi:hypothetical protein
MPKIKLPARNRVFLYLDVVLVVAFAADMELRFTGLHIHELLGVGIGIVFLLHLILHWKWILGITKSFFRRLLHESRLRYVLNLILFVDAALMIVSGILISRTIGLNFNVRGPGQLPWERIHVLSSELSLILVGLHVALNWSWILNQSKKYFFGFFGGKKRTKPVATVKEASVSQISSSEV